MAASAHARAQDFALAPHVGKLTAIYEDVVARHRERVGAGALLAPG